MDDNFKKIIFFILIIVLISILVFFLINSANKIVNVLNEKTDQNMENVDQKKEIEQEKKETKDSSYYLKKAEEMFSKPKKGEQIAIMHVKNFGVIKFKFFKDVAPKAVENFLTHAKNGYYNGLTFHRVINDFMIQGGDPEGTGRGGKSIWGEPFEKEVSKDYFPYKGTLCMASTSLPKSIGSQFFITQANVHRELSSIPPEYAKAYNKYGGAPHLLGGYTVFGVVYEGLDIVDKISKVETDKTNDMPKIPVVIEKIEVREAE